MFGFSKIFSGIVGIGGGATSMQFPNFINQYEHYLRGRLDQARIAYDRIAAQARESSMSIENYTSYFQQHQDQVVQRQGASLDAAVNDYNQLTTSLDALESSTALTRPFEFVKQVDWPSIHKTLDSFSPSLILTTEGMLYGLVGFAVSLAFFSVLFKVVVSFFLLPLRKNKEKVANQTSL